ncbi:MAG TPA: molybdopterin cofactor-binding domain-containing protein [Oleiagrimonas sp.]|nr:molybdopterin cofactor-binding domain-containing protein [Oleiagrimonas sp.]
MTDSVRLSRRRFLKVMAGATGALIVGVGTVRAADTDLPLALLGDEMTQLGPYLRIEPDGRTIIGARDPDCGEGTHTSLARIIADELDGDWSRVTVLGLGPEVTRANNVVHWRYGHQRSGNATSIPAAWADLRQAGALARWLLLQTAARHSGVAAARLQCHKGAVLTPNGRRYAYGELVADAARQSPPTTPPPVKRPDQYALIGRGAGDVDARAMVQGHSRYAIDHYPGEMLVAVVRHCPWPGGSLASIDTTEALKVPGVEQVLQVKPESGQPLGHTPIAPGVAVLAQDTWSALKGFDKLKLTWQPGPHVDASTARLRDEAVKLLDSEAEPTTHVRSDGDIDKAEKQAHRHVEATYTQPFVAHATAEPINCTARVDADHASLIVPTQAPQQALALVQRLTGLSPDQIDIQVPRTGGGLGRRVDHDFVAEAVMLAKAAGKCVKLMWTREDGLTHDFYRPMAVHKLKASLDRDGHIIGWRQHMASPSALAGRSTPADRLWTSEVDPDALPAGLVENLDSSWYGLDSVLSRGPMRGANNVTNTFVVEGFLDEIAHELRRDPLELRHELLGDPRMIPLRGGGALDTRRLRAVLDLAAARIDWKHPPRNGHGLGIACHASYGGYCAHAFEVSVRGERLIVHRAVCAIDVGRVVNPIGLEAQAMGGTLFGIGTALGQAITVADGQVQQHDFNDYPLAHMAQLPHKVEVYAVPSDAAPGGASPVAVSSAVPALANAVHAATTVRIRRLPLMTELLRLL